MRVVSTAIAAVGLLLIAATTNAAGVKGYKTEDGAQRHCPNDTVVWGTSQSGVYHMKGAASYGTTKSGKYVCMAEATAAGWHSAKNN